MVVVPSIKPLSGEWLKLSGLRSLGVMCVLYSSWGAKGQRRYGWEERNTSAFLSEYLPNIKM
jgi:hypothetical protein